MISLTKKQLIILGVFLICLLVGFGFYFYYSFTSSPSSADLVGNILENAVENNLEDEEDTMPNAESESQDDIIFVHITGCVFSPGLISLPEGSRIADAITKAGGVTENADLSQLNLAYVLEDGLKIYIPSYEDSKKEEIPNVLSEGAGDNIVVEDSTSTSSTNHGQKVNINTATQTELETIPGVGPSTALKIIAYRKENGNFAKIEDIQNVKGIGEAKYAEMKDSICVK